MKKVKILTSLSLFLFSLMFFVGIKVSAADYDEENFWFRATPKKVIQDDPYTESICDIINLYSHYKMSVSDLIAKGHETISLKITFEGKEVHDGYQEILIFDKPDERDVTNALAKKTDIELAHGKIQKEYLSVEVYLIIPLKKVSEDFIVIRWGAHGEGYDDWYCRNVKVCFEKL
ncbi:MAG: hypothetical protein K2K48_01265 [Anaeroplasmataceae bacterium]|nr:hypothetical protein [Anaeroplasmataceae bacterium]MDE6414019.1 hypothetical protein [Anaeroplasmataceae bacterium]